MPPGEARFREVERLLDRRLSEFRQSPASAGLSFHERSGRNYYKNEVLFWLWKIVQDTPVDVEVERISVSLEYTEPRNVGDADVLTVLVQSEVFRQGQISRIDRRHEDRLSVAQVRDVGFRPALQDAFERGRNLLVKDAP